ncbi:MAG: hypothetical protein LBR11_01960 [Deltaproteobacteria bacterium]|nr:hypothetical protein [Deltaproteobacteria bacterium]
MTAQLTDFEAEIGQLGLKLFLRQRQHENFRAWVLQLIATESLSDLYNLTPPA